jgi:4-amino-4-deoxy-L-arabinose transferase-like glycosyltransferase
MDLLDTRRPRTLLIALCLILWLPGLFSLPPTDRDESRFAQASKQMLETGDYVRIMNGDEPRNRKPIGIYWLQVPFAAAAHAAGLAGCPPCWAVYWRCWRWSGWGETWWGGGQHCWQRGCWRLACWW